MGNRTSNLAFDNLLERLLEARRPEIQQCRVKINFKVFNYLDEMVNPLDLTLELDTTANTATKLVGVRAEYRSRLEEVRQRIKPHVTLSRMIVQVTGDVLQDSMFAPEVVAEMLRYAIEVLALTLPAEVVRPSNVVVEQLHPLSMDEVHVFEDACALYVIREEVSAERARRNAVGVTLAVRRRNGYLEPRILTHKKRLEKIKQLGEEPI
jgi:hypothetical protein